MSHAIRCLPNRKSNINIFFAAAAATFACKNSSFWFLFACRFTKNVNHKFYSEQHFFSLPSSLRMKNSPCNSFSKKIYGFSHRNIHFAFSLHSSCNWNKTFIKKWLRRRTKSYVETLWTYEQKKLSDLENDFAFILHGPVVVWIDNEKLLFIDVQNF